MENFKTTIKDILTVEEYKRLDESKCITTVCFIKDLLDTLDFDKPIWENQDKITSVIGYYKK